MTHRSRPSVLLALTIVVAAYALAPRAGAAQTGTAWTPDLPVVEHVLQNGMRFLLLRREGAPTISFTLDVAVGSLDDPPGGRGAAHLLEHLLFKGSTSIGTTDLSAEQALFQRMDAALDSAMTLDAGERGRLMARIDALEDSARAFAIPDEFSAIYARNGARGLNATTGYHETRFTVALPANRIELWFVLESDRFRNPVFRDFFAERRVVLEERRSRLESSPGATLRATALAAAFPDHGYGRPPLGYREDLEALGRPAVEAFFRERYRPDRMTVAMVGDFDTDHAVELADRYFGRLETRSTAAPPPPGAAQLDQAGERRVEVLFDAQPQMHFAWRIPGATHPDTPALLVLANLLVGASDARLTRRVVSEERLAGSVVADLGPGSAGARLFTIQASPLPGRSPEELEDAVYEDIDRLRSAPPDLEELSRVRTRLEAAEARSLASNEGLASQLLTAQALWGDWRQVFRTPRAMRTVSPDDIARVVDEYFRPDGRTVGVLRRSEPEADR